ncbi:MAG: UDP-N-acetylmuramate dehydrogenase [Pseudomonadales bacterium]
MNIEIQQDISLREFNTLGLDVAAKHFAIVRSEDDVRYALAVAQESAWPITVLGGGSNLVLCHDVEGLVILVAIPGILFDGNQVEAGAGESWHHLVLCSLEQGLSGIENLSLIPGSVGAAPIQNIGAYGVELVSVFDSLVAVDRESRQTVVLTREDCEFGYRNSIFKRKAKDRFVITRVRLNLSAVFEPNLSYRELEEAVSGLTLTPTVVSEVVSRIRRSKLPDPDQIGNVGSFFKNPVVDGARFVHLKREYRDIPFWETDHGVKLSAGWLIDQCGLKGYRVGDAAISADHALVIINMGRATGPDVVGLAEYVQDMVNSRFDLQLEIEPTIT